MPVGWMNSSMPVGRMNSSMPVGRMNSSMPVGRMNHFYFFLKRSLRFKNNEEKTENEKVIIKIVRF